MCQIQVVSWVWQSVSLSIYLLYFMHLLCVYWRSLIAYQNITQHTSFLLAWPAAAACFGRPGLTLGPLTTFMRSATLTLICPNFSFISFRFSILKPPEPDSLTMTSIFSERHREQPSGNLVVAFGWLEMPNAQFLPPVQSVLTCRVLAI